MKSPRSSRMDRATAELEQAMRERGNLGRKPPPVRRHGAISLIQPWAWAVVHADEWVEGPGKKTENRSQPTTCREMVLIHVSKTWSLRAVEATLTALRVRGLVGGKNPEPSIEDLKAMLGKAVARCQILDCRMIEDNDPDPWAVAGSWGWMLGPIEPIEPIELNGNTGLWRAPPDLEIVTKQETHVLEIGGETQTHGDWSGVLHALLSAGCHGMRISDQVKIDGEEVTLGELLARIAERRGDQAMARSFRLAEKKDMT